MITVEDFAESDSDGRFDFTGLYDLMLSKLPDRKNTIIKTFTLNFDMENLDHI